MASAGNVPMEPASLAQSTQLPHGPRGPPLLSSSSSSIRRTFLCLKARRLSRAHRHGFAPKIARAPELFSQNLLVRVHSSFGDLESAVFLLERMAKGGADRPNGGAAMVSVLSWCAHLKALHFGRKVHEVAKRSGGLHREVRVATALLEMYASCGRIDTAQEVFDEMPAKDVVTWTAMINVLVGHGRRLEAPELFRRMRESGEDRNGRIIVAVLGEYGDIAALSFGKEVDGVVRRTGLHRESYVATALLDIYAKRGVVDAVRKVFDEMRDREVVLWMAMMARPVGQGRCLEALELFLGMRVARVEPDWKTLAAMLRARAELRELSIGRVAPKFVKKKRFHRNVATSLLHFYAQCGRMETAREVFDEMPERDAVAWRTTMVELASHGRCREALELLQRMRDVGRLEPDEWTVIEVLRACANAADLGHEGDLDLHGWERDETRDPNHQEARYGTGMADPLARARHLNEAMLSVCLSTGFMELANLLEATQLHAHIIKTGCVDSCSLPLKRLLDFSTLSPSGDLSYARSIFDSLRHPDTNCTNYLIRAYAKHSNNPTEALRLFASLRLRGLASNPDEYTFMFLLNACCRIRNSCHGRQLHGLAVTGGLASEFNVQNSLAHMYSSCGDLGSALHVFNRMASKDITAWTTVIDGARKGGRPLDALEFFERMEREGIDPDDVTLVSVLLVCMELGALSVGRRVHEIAKKSGLHRQSHVATALINMYAKCGHIDRARKVFDGMPAKSVFMWASMIAGLGSHGRCREALDLFHRMRDDGVKPTGQTISSVLCACRNAGWIEEGYWYFNYWKKHGTGKLKLCDYGCMVHMLARAGYLAEAEEFIKGMPLEPDEAIWRTLIWASRFHGDNGRAQRLVNEQLMRMDPAESGSYVLAGNVYSSVSRWDEKARVRMLMDQKMGGKPPAWSRIEVKGVIHQFEAGDSSHPEACKVHEKWGEIEERLREEGYRPNTSEVLLDMEDEEKALQLKHHSEKLALAFGLISAYPGEKIVITKNLRSCRDCHNAMKLVSKVYNREIIIRDRNRFHYFRQGGCSCGDFW